MLEAQIFEMAAMTGTGVRCENSHTRECGHVQSTSIVQTVPLCPSYVPTRSPLSVNQTLMTWSFEQENNKSPSRLNLICVSDRSCPVHPPNHRSISTGAHICLQL